MQSGVSKRGCGLHLDDFGVDVALLLGAVQDGLFYGPCRHQHQHEHRLLLPYAVCAIPSLYPCPHSLLTSQGIVSCPFITLQHTSFACKRLNRPFALLKPIACLSLCKKCIKRVFVVWSLPSACALGQKLPKVSALLIHFWQSWITAQQERTGGHLVLNRPAGPSEDSSRSRTSGPACNKHRRPSDGTLL